MSFSGYFRLKFYLFQVVFLAKNHTVFDSVLHFEIVLDCLERIVGDYMLHPTSVLLGIEKIKSHFDKSVRQRFVACKDALRLCFADLGEFDCAVLAHFDISVLFHYADGSR